MGETPFKKTGTDIFLQGYGLSELSSFIHHLWLSYGDDLGHFLFCEPVVRVREGKWAEQEEEVKLRQWGLWAPGWHQLDRAQRIINRHHTDQSCDGKWQEVAKNTYMAKSQSPGVALVPVVLYPKVNSIGGAYVLL